MQELRLALLHAGHFRSAATLVGSPILCTLAGRDCEAARVQSVTNLLCLESCCLGPGSRQQQSPRTHCCYQHLPFHKNGQPSECRVSSHFAEDAVQQAPALCIYEVICTREQQCLHVQRLSRSTMKVCPGDSCLAMTDGLSAFVEGHMLQQVLRDVRPASQS